MHYLCIEPSVKKENMPEILNSFYPLTVFYHDPSNNYNYNLKRELLRRRESKFVMTPAVMETKSTTITTGLFLRELPRTWEIQHIIYLYLVITSYVLNLYIYLLFVAEIKFLSENKNYFYYQSLIPHYTQTSLDLILSIFRS